MKILSKSPLVFEIEADLLENRKDVFYYHPQILELKKKIKKLEKHKYKLKKFGEIIKLIYRYPTFYGINYLNHGIRVLKGENIIDGEIVITKEESFISPEDNQRFRKTVLKEDDLIFSVRATIGKVGFVTKEFEGSNINANLVRISLIDEINPRYVWVYLNTKIGQALIENIISGTVQSTITIPDITSIMIPIPPIEVQNKIAEIILEAYKQKKRKLQIAKTLLEKINHIVLKELHVTIREIEVRRTYWVSPNDLEGRRDPVFYSPGYLMLLNAIENSPYEVKTLKQISKTIVSGQRPKGGVKYIEDGVPSIGGEHITSEGDFNFENIRFIPKQFHQQQKKSRVKPYDILIVKDGATTGKVAIVPKEFPFKECNINEHVFKIEVKDGYNPYYVFSYLFSSLGQEQINRLISGAAQKGITRDAIESTKIIVPPLEIQNTIANEIRKRKEESKRLKKEAEEVVENAKKEVEKMIMEET